MSHRSLRRAWPAGAAAAAVALVLALAGLGPSASHGQNNPSATPTAQPPISSSNSTAGGTASGPAVAASGPVIDNDTAVRTLLPAQFRNADPLPGKWARADMPNAPGGYVVFIATVYPMADDAGNPAWWLLTNYLQWDGTEWIKGLNDYRGEKLVGEGGWIAQNLTDITALASPDPSWAVFTVAYTADGLVSPTLGRTETLVEIYDLTLTTLWSRDDYLRDIDTGHTGYVKTHTENVDWEFKDIDGDGIAELVATVNTTDDITLTGDPAPSLPDPGSTTTTSTEVYKWVDGVFVMARQGSTSAPSTGGTLPPAPTPTSRAAPTASAAGTPAPTPSAATPTSTSSPAPAGTSTPTPAAGPQATPAATGTPAG